MKTRKTNWMMNILCLIFKEKGGKDLIDFSQYKLQKLLSKQAFDRLTKGKSSLGRIQLYGGSLGQYYALNIANGDFYKRLKEEK